MEISKVNTQVSLSDNEMGEYCKSVWKINLIVSYPLTDTMIESMVKNIMRLRPQTTISEINTIVDDFITGKREYVANKGITNFFRELDGQTLGFKLNL